MKNLKCIFVGDYDSDKSQLVELLVGNISSLENSEVYRSASTTYIEAGSYPTNITLYDPSVEEKFKKLRLIGYYGTDVFIAAFHFARPKTLKNLEKMWIPEVLSACPNVPIVLVGIGAECLDDPNIGEQVIPISDVLTFFKKVPNFYDYKICSLKKCDIPSQIFDLIYNAVFEPSKKAASMQSSSIEINTKNIAVAIGDFEKLPYCPDDDNELRVIQQKDLKDISRIPQILIVVLSKKKSIESVLKEFQDLPYTVKKSSNVILVKSCTTDRPCDIVEIDIKEMIRQTNASRCIEIDERWRWERFRDCILNPDKDVKEEISTNNYECRIA